MWKEIINFEIAYRKKRPATYIYFGILFLIGFLIVSTDAIEMFGTGGQVKENGTFPIFQTFGIVSMCSIFVVSAIMGVAILRDFEHRTEAIFFTTNLNKFDYLFGRFVGSFKVLFFISLGIPLGILIGSLMPWRDASRMLSFNILPYLYNYFILILPNIFIMSAIFFSVGALSRKMIVVFMQGVVFLLLYLFSGKLLGQLDKLEIAALLDPIGVRAASLQARYWSIAQKNHAYILPIDTFLYNRLLWMAIEALCLWLTYRVFSFSQVLNPIIRKKSISASKSRPELLNEALPEVTLKFNNYFLQLVELTKIYYKNIVKDLPFIGLSLCGILIFVFTTTSIKGWYGTTVVPSTYMMLEGMGILTGMFADILAIMYVGELIWKERDIRMNLIHDALPINTHIVMIGKFLGITLSFCVLYFVAILVSMGIQTINGFYDYQPMLYVSKLYGEALIQISIFVLLGFFIHSLVNNKFLGHGIMILVLLTDVVLSFWGVEHSLLMFSSESLGEYSEMNTFGHFVPAFTWSSIYWAAFVCGLFAVGSLLAVRGTEELLKLRLKIGGIQLNKSILTFLLLMVITFVSSGFYIYYNANMLNTYKNTEDKEKQAAMYEKTLKKYENAPQPKITDVKLIVDLMPESRNFTTEGSYWLKNKTPKSIKDLYLMAGIYEDMKVDYLKLSVANSLNPQYVKDYDFYIYTLEKALQPNDSIKLDFKISFKTKGFVQGKGNTNIVNNGTFFNNSYFPMVGYVDRFELADDDKRKEQGLKERPRALERNSPIGLSRNVLGADADFINFDMTISTSPDQTAIAPGYLQKEWLANGKRHFHYVMDVPICNFYSIVSAKYAVKREKYKGINLEIYYHPTHTYNLERMMKAMKASLDYYQSNFSPYQYRQLRIMEFPRYEGFAQSFANTIPFGEGMGFVMKIDDKKDIDIPFFVTAHEIAHQWWGHQTVEADVKGSGMLSESLAEYSALMTMSKYTSKEQMHRFLENELDYYLRGRASEHKNEQPLATCENQSYIHYYKGSLVLYAIQDYIGEAKLNGALQNYLRKWNWKQVNRTGIYPNTNDLVKEIRAVTPDSLQYLVSDFIESITLYENKATKAQVQKLNGKYKVMLTVESQKIKADSLGNEKPTKMKEWLWVGVYGKPDKDGKERLIYYQRHLISQPHQQFTIWVNEEPQKAGIDPLNLLIDRHIKDNVVKVE